MTDRTAPQFGAAPESLGVFDLDFHEYMHFMYLPIRIPEVPTDDIFDVVMPARLHFTWQLVAEAIAAEACRGNEWSHIYLTARRGFATPGNPLNRPGWHSDGFGTPDINYVWTDRYPTLFAVQEFHDISTDHVESARQFETQIDPNRVLTDDDRVLQRLDSSVIHAAPSIPAPGGERSFLKVSFSNDRYDLVGNSHNHGLFYEWPMFSREQVRNDPSHAGKDSRS